MIEGRNVSLTGHLSAREASTYKSAGRSCRAMLHPVLLGRAREAEPLVGSRGAGQSQQPAEAPVERRGCRPKARTRVRLWIQARPRSGCRAADALRPLSGEADRAAGAGAGGAQGGGKHGRMAEASASDFNFLKALKSSGQLVVEQPDAAAPVGNSPRAAGGAGEERRGSGAGRAPRGPPCSCPASFPFPSRGQPSPAWPGRAALRAPAPPPPCRARAGSARWGCCRCCRCCWGCRRPGPATSPPGARWTPGRCPHGLTRRSSACSSTGACSRCPASAASGSGERQPEPGRARAPGSAGSSVGTGGDGVGAVSPHCGGLGWSPSAG